nr:hypothetical protein [Tanacetum cinerariifolium]
MIALAVASTVASLSDTDGKPLNLLRGCRQCAGTEDKAANASATAGREVVGDLHLLRDGLTNGNGEEQDLLQDGLKYVADGADDEDPDNAYDDNDDNLDDDDVLDDDDDVLNVDDENFDDDSDGATIH